MGTASVTQRRLSFGLSELFDNYGQTSKLVGVKPRLVRPPEPDQPLTLLMGTFISSSRLLGVQDFQKSPLVFGLGLVFHLAKDFDLVLVDGFSQLLRQVPALLGAHLTGDFAHNVLNKSVFHSTFLQL